MCIVANEFNEQFKNLNKAREIISSSKVRVAFNNIDDIKSRLNKVVNELNEKIEAIRVSQEPVIEVKETPIVETKVEETVVEEKVEVVAEEKAPITETVEKIEEVKEDTVKAEEETVAPPKTEAAKPQYVKTQNTNTQNGYVKTGQNQRPNTNTNNTSRPNNQNRPNGQGTGGFQNKPQGGGFNRPQNNNAPRPSFIHSRPEPAIIPVDTSKDKKKNKSTFTGNRDDNRKVFNKRDLIKKGYVANVLGDEEEINGRIFKNRKQKRSMTKIEPITITNAVLNSEIVPIKNFSEKIGKPVGEIIKKLFDMGIMVTINDSIPFETAELIAIDYDITLELKADKSAEEKMNDTLNENFNDGDLEVRPPVVTIMGHVDHGKTSLLDYIRKANVVSSEAGGITQHIGAYTIDVDGSKITFLDTPGHEAFTSMRKRGARVTDIAIIVVAADDGIMPQSIEAINHAKDAGVSIIVAINKIDKPGADVQKTMQQLTQYGIVPEEWGGDVICCPVCAKTGEGVPKLLESILLVAEVSELKANKNCLATGSVIEARLDKGLGPVATVLIQNGTLKVSDSFVAGVAVGKVRSMTDCTGKRVKTAGPSYAVQIHGFTEVPNAGDNLVALKDDRLAKQVAQERINKKKLDENVQVARNLDDLFKGAGGEEVKKLPLIIKADVQGSAEAVKQSLIKLSDSMAEDNVKITIVHTGVGAVNESDVMLADTSNAIIIAFNIKTEPKAKLYADRSKIEIRSYRIIYDVIDDITKALTGMLEPVYEERIQGHAEVRAVFKITGAGIIAGSYVLDGKVIRNAKARLSRNGEVIATTNIASVKRGKDDVKDVAFGYECGISLENCKDIQENDIIECFILERIK